MSLQIPSGASDGTISMSVGKAPNVSLAAAVAGGLQAEKIK